MSAFIATIDNSSQFYFNQADICLLYTSTLIKKYMDSLDDKDSIKRAYKQHKSLYAYTKSVSYTHLDVYKRQLNSGFVTTKQLIIQKNICFNYEKY